MLKEHIDRKNTFWNMIAALINALESVVIIAVTARVHSVETAGIFTIGFSLANLFLMIGKFGVRNFQIANEGFSVDRPVFYSQRRITTALMVLTGCVYLLGKHLFGGYDIEKAAIILGVILWYAVESLEDCYMGSFQMEGKLHLGCKVFIARWLSLFAGFVLTDLLTTNAVLAVYISLAASILTEGILLSVFAKRLGIREKPRSNGQLRLLFRKTLPLFLAAFLYFFMTNLSKYAIDQYLSDTDQAIYGYIAMPVFVIALLNNMIYVPQLNYYVEAFRNNNRAELIRRIRRQLGLIVCIFAGCLIGAYFLGIPVLNMLYNARLEEQKTQMMLLLTGSFFLAVAGYLSALLVIFDQRVLNLLLYGVSVAVGLVATFLLTASYAINGAVAGYLVTMVLAAGGFLLATFRVLSKMNRKVLSAAQ